MAVTPEQHTWLLTRYQEFLKHQLKKTMRIFFPAIYLEFRHLWPCIPTATDVGTAEGFEVARAALCDKQNEVSYDLHTQTTQHD